MQLQNNINLKAEELTEKLYDLSMIEQLCRGNQEQVKKMMTVFINQVPQAVEEIRMAYSNKDFATIKNTAHRIKPTLSYYAIVTIEKDVQQIEAMAKEGFSTIELEVKINKLAAVITQVAEKMKQDLL